MKRSTSEIGGGELVSITVEGKVSEPFGPTLGEWYKDVSKGKMERLAFLQHELGLDSPPHASEGYQLLHRTVSAIIEAKRFNAKHAVMLVHSFSQENEWFDDYRVFLSLFGKKARLGSWSRWVTSAEGLSIWDGVKEMSDIYDFDLQENSKTVTSVYLA